MARITGRFGTLSIDGGSTTVANLFNWALEYTVEAVPCPIKGEKANTVSVGGIDIRITAERFVEHTSDATGGSILGSLAVSQMAADPPGAIIDYQLDQLLGAGGQRISGQGVVIRGSVNAPRDLATDSFEVHGTNLPTLTITTS